MKSKKINEYDEEYICKIILIILFIIIGIIVILILIAGIIVTTSNTKVSTFNNNFWMTRQTISRLGKSYKKSDIKLDNRYIPDIGIFEFTKEDITTIKYLNKQNLLLNITSRINACCTSILNSNDGICFGGFGYKYQSNNDEELGYLNDLWYYDSNKNNWILLISEKLLDLSNQIYPHPRSYSSCWLNNNEFIILGGNYNNTIIFGDMWKIKLDREYITNFNVKNNFNDLNNVYKYKWIKLYEDLSNITPGKRYNSYISYYNNYDTILLFGGYNIHTNTMIVLTDIWIYSKNKWNNIIKNVEILNENYKIRYDYNVCLLDNQLLIQNGINYHTNEHLYDIWSFDINNGRFKNIIKSSEIINNKTSGLCWYSNYNNKVYILGGIFNNEIFMDISILDIQKKKLTVINGPLFPNMDYIYNDHNPYLNSPVVTKYYSHWLSNNNRIYILGGISKNGIMNSDLWFYVY